jgi:DNA invertase Pin-like site-specific DNA recombinase
VRCAVYARVSSAEQKAKNTIASQLRLLPEHARQQGWELVDQYVDDGYSGSTVEGRPAFTRLLADVEAGAIDVVLAIDADRITRSSQTLQRALIFDTFRRCGVQLATPSGVIDLQDDAQSMTADILGSVAAFERRKFLARTARGKREKVKQGKFRAGIDPYGYRWADGAYEINPTEAAVVRRMFQLARREGVNMLTWRLNQEGHRTRRGGVFRTSSVGKILRSRTYYGHHVVFKGEGLPPIPTPPLVTREQWTETQQALRERRSVAKTKHGTPLLSGLLRCGICGRHMWCVRARGNQQHRYSYYRCASTNGWRREGLKGPCGQLHHRTDALEAAVWEAVCKAVRCTKLAAPGVDEAATRQRIQELDGLEQEVMQRRRRTLITAQTCDRELGEIARERAGLESALRAEPVAVSKLDLRRLDHLDDESKRRVIALVGMVRVGRDGELQVG